MYRYQLPNSSLRVGQFQKEARGSPHPETVSRVPAQGRRRQVVDFWGARVLPVSVIRRCSPGEKEVSKYQKAFPREKRVKDKSECFSVYLLS